MNRFLSIRTRFFSILTLALVGMAITASGQTSGAGSHADGTLRVGLWTLWHDKALTAAPASSASATIRSCESCAARVFSHPIQIKAASGKVIAGDGDPAASVWLGGALQLSAHGETVMLHNPVRVSARSGELVLAVTLPVESYVERVVASESGAADGPESLKALAIVVRSFALHQAHGHADYDLCDSTHCQLLHWSGASDRRAAAHSATLSTAGEALWFHGQRAAAWFHQNCGGRTAGPAEVWPGKSANAATAMPWLVSRADPYCTAHGAREWSATISLADLTAALSAAGVARPGWKTLTVARRGESGRAATLLVGSTRISAEDFRIAVGRAMGWGKILSTWFEVSRLDSAQGTQFAFHGRGSGHGVGLCQAGAAAMSAQGHDAGQILAQFFPGATVADEASGTAWQSMRAQAFNLETLDASDGQLLPQLSHALGEAESRSGLQPAGTITLRFFRSTEAFRRATLAPGWVAAFTEGNWIGAQPLRTLASRKLLAPVMRHEFLHALVESQAAPSTPLWLREGLVEAWAGDPVAKQPAPRLKLDQADRALAGADNEAQSKAAHDAAAFYAQRLLDRFGRGQVLAWLRNGLPASALAAIQ